MGELAPALPSGPIGGDLIGECRQLRLDPIELALFGAAHYGVFGGGGHHTSSRIFPAIDISAGTGSSLPGNRMFQ